VPELAGTVQILDAYVDLHPRPWLRLRVGKFKAPIGLERLQSDADLPIVERALDQNLSSQRDVGVQLWGDAAGGIVNYVAGIINGAADTTGADTDLDHAKDFVGRIFFEPFKLESLRDFGSLGIGFGAQTGNRKGRLPTAVSGLPIPSVAAQTGLSGFRTAGQNTFFSYFAPATDTSGSTTTFTHERATRINPQLFYYYDNVGLLAEYLYLWQGVQRGNRTAVLKHQAAHATLSYTLGGREGFDGVTPLVGFDPAKRAWGALQLAARWSWFKADPLSFGDPNVAGSAVYADPLKSARSAQSFAGGLAWVPRRTLRVSLDYEQTRFKGGAGTAAVAATPGVPAMPAVGFDRRTEYVFIGRAQVNF
jgi:phosphate-selective porin OprO/OprP